MDHQRHPIVPRGIRLTMCLATLGAMLLQHMPLLAQQPPIQIVAPTPGTILTSGQPFSVIVAVAPGSTFNGVAVIAQNIGLSPTLASGPFTFPFVAPGAGFSGPLALTAVGITAGKPTFSPSVTVSIETSATPSALTVTPRKLAFTFGGQQVPLMVSGTFADGSTSDMTNSALTRYTSTDTTVADVATNGLVTAIGLGTATTAQITITYGTQSASIPVSVPRTLRGDLNGDGVIDQEDLNILLSALNSPATKPFDARDLNSDGRIDQLDAAILVTLCTQTCRLPQGDTTPPVIAPQIIGTLGNNGWYRSNITVTWNVNDPESGIVGTSGCATTTITNDTPGTTLTCSATNGAGLTASVPLTLRIDKTPPFAAATLAPIPNANGWNNTSVTVSFAGNDNLSGIDSCSPPQIITSEGAAQTAMGTCADKAGNISAPATAKVNIDKTPPVISGMPATGCTLWPPDKRLVQVATVTATDALSGLTPGSLRVTGTSNEPIDPNDPAIVIMPNGTGGFVVQFRADRLGDGTGRIYTLTATANDQAGNMTTATATCAVPHDKGN